MSDSTKPGAITVIGAGPGAGRHPDIALHVRRLDALDWAHLHRDEAALIGPAATEKRRAEFACGRRAAKDAVADLLGLVGGDAGAWTILREPGEMYGRPYISRARDGARLDLHVSISHADGLAIAAVARCPLGLDLVTVEHHSDAFADEAFAPSEIAGWRASLPGAGEPLIRSLAFAAKEAALKWLGCGMRVPMRSVSIVPVEPLEPPSELASRFSVRVLSSVAGPSGPSSLTAWAGALGDKLWFLLAEERSGR